MYNNRRDGLPNEGQGHLGHVRSRSLQPPVAGNSNSWSSTRTLEGARLLRLKGMASHLGLLRSPFFPKNIGQYASHLQEVHAEKIRVENARIQERILRTKLVDEWGKQFKYKKFLNGKTVEFERVDGRASNIERVWPYGTRNQVDAESEIGWPSILDGKFHGEQRANKGLERQLPLPRKKVDEEMVARLTKVGVALETAVDLLHAPEEQVGSMLLQALDGCGCGLDELAWRKMEAELIESEKVEHDKLEMLRLEAILNELDAWILDDEVPIGGHKFDEAELENTGIWAEILDELNKV